MDHVWVFACLVVISITGSCQGCTVNSKGNGPPLGWDVSGRGRGTQSRPGSYPRPEIGGTVPVLPSLVTKTEDFNLIDTNGDGLVTILEWEATFLYLLENYDANGDGMISLSELNPSPTVTSLPIDRLLNNNVRVPAPATNIELAPPRNRGVPRGETIPASLNEPVIAPRPRPPIRPRPRPGYVPYTRFDELPSRGRVGYPAP